MKPEQLKDVPEVYFECVTKAAEEMNPVQLTLTGPEAFSLAVSTLRGKARPDKQSELLMAAFSGIGTAMSYGFLANEAVEAVMGGLNDALPEGNKLPRYLKPLLTEIMKKLTEVKDRDYPDLPRI